MDEKQIKELLEVLEKGLKGDLIDRLTITIKPQKAKPKSQKPKQ